MLDAKIYRFDGYFVDQQGNVVCDVDTGEVLGPYGNEITAMKVLEQYRDSVVAGRYATIQGQIQMCGLPRIHEGKWEAFR